MWRETLAFLSAEPPEVKTNIIDLALALEAHTAPLRPEDDPNCHDSLERRVYLARAACLKARG